MKINPDFYYPNNPDTSDSEGITILILQGVEIDQKEYQDLAEALADKNYQVIVPNFDKPGGYFCPDFESFSQFLAFQETVTPGFQNSLKDRLFLLGHSAGGSAALGAFAKYAPPLIIKPLGIILYGSAPRNVDDKQEPFPPILTVVGADDTIVTPRIAKSCFQSFSCDKKALLILKNFDHFSLTNTGTPDEYLDEENTQLSLYGLEAIPLLTEIIHQFILDCLNQTNNLKNLDIDLALEQKTNY